MYYYPQIIIRFTQGYILWSHFLEENKEENWAWQKHLYTVSNLELMAQVYGRRGSNIGGSGVTCVTLIVTSAEVHFHHDDTVM